MVFMSNPYHLERIHEGYMYVCTQYVLVPVFKVSECTCVHVYLCNLTCLHAPCVPERGCMHVQQVFMNISMYVQLVRACVQPFIIFIIWIMYEQFWVRE